MEEVFFFFSQKTEYFCRGAAGCPANRPKTEQNFAQNVQHGAAERQKPCQRAESHTRQRVQPQQSAARIEHETPQRTERQQAEQRVPQVTQPNGAAQRAEHIVEQHQRSAPQQRGGKFPHLYADGQFHQRNRRARNPPSRTSDS